MLQRIQTIYLLGAAIAAGLMFLFPIAQANLQLMGDARVFSFLVQNNMGLVICTGAVVLISLSNIFLFKNRPLQVKLSYLLMLLGLVLYGLIWFFGQEMNASLPDLVETQYGPGLYMPAIVFVLSYLASSAIQKDEDLVRSADRFR